MRDQSAVSPIIGTLLVFVIFTTATALVIGVGRPALIEYQEKGKFDSVVGQLGNVAGEMNQLVVSGEQFQVKQPRVTFPGGELTADEGHWMVVHVGYFDPSYGAAAGRTQAPGSAPRFAWLPGMWLNPDPAPQPNSNFYSGFHYDDDFPPPSAETATVEAYHYADGAWHYISPITTGMQSPAQIAWGFQGTLSQQPLRFDRIGPETPLGPDKLIGQTFIFKTPRLTYNFDGHAGPRYVHIENGAVFREENGRFTQVGEGLLAAPNTTLGNTAMTFRVVNFDPLGLAAGGASKVGVLMRNDGSEPFAYNGGAAWVNIQVWGEYPEIWYEYLESNGFTREPAGSDFKGVSYAQINNQGNYVAFPFHFFYSDVFMRISNT